ncbi:MAG: hypothetical protein ABI172_12680 [Ginsengibacter sp.]|jgi:hypothetical protein
MQQYDLTLKNEKVGLYRNMAWIFLILNIAIFILLLFYDAFRYTASAFIIALAVYILMRWFIFNKYKTGHFLDEFVFFIPAAGWFGLHSYGIAIVCIIMGFLYKFSLQQLTFIFTREKVMKVNFPKKHFNWDSFSNVLLKGNILTLDFKNNKLIQVEIEPLQNANEEQFNSFAKTQIELSNNNI